jgi:hypothetical protein
MTRPSQPSLWMTHWLAVAYSRDRNRPQTWGGDERAAVATVLRQERSCVVRDGDRPRGGWLGGGLVAMAAVL